MSLPQILVDGDEPITFTEIEPWHRDRLVQMHEDLFPVKYSKGFYDKAVIKTGLRGCPLFTSIAFQKRGGLDVMVGFVMAQFLPVEQCDARSDLFDALNEPEYVYYILTLGVEKSMRCTGLGTTLLHQCLDHAATNLACGAVYLHVITYNKPALRFYFKNGFVSIAEYPAFYKIHDHNYSSELCALYINGFKPSLFTRVQHFFKSRSNSFVQWFKGVFSDETDPIEPTKDPYMDDLILPSQENQLTCLTEKSKIMSSTSTAVAEDRDAPPGFSLGDDNDHVYGGADSNDVCGSHDSNALYDTV